MRSSRRPTPDRRRVGLLALVLAGAAVVAAPIALGPVGLSPASADPATSISYGKGAAPSRYVGRAFDTCAAPSLAAMQAWRASPYRAIGVYVSGSTRTCAQPNLTASWVRSVTSLGWKLIPIHKGRQPPCGGRPTDAKIDPATATTQGATAAAEAATAMSALGLIGGSAAYLDIEQYTIGDKACSNAVVGFVSGWTREMHRRGFVAGVYVNLNFGAKDLVAAYTSTTRARPDAVWFARWDGSTSLSNLAGVPNAYWSNHQRIKQYRGDHNETYGGLTLNIDSDYVDAPVATVARSFSISSSSALTARTGPSTSYPAVRKIPVGSTVTVACQTAGSAVGGTTVWDKLTDGSYVTDRYVRTGSSGYSPALPRCRYPYQITASDGLNMRSGPGTSFAIRGTLSPGALAWVACQVRPSGTTTVWNRLDTGYYVSDRYVATPSSTGFSAPIPRC